MKYLTLDGLWVERDPKEKTPCAECGMFAFDNEYHPFAACLMFKQTENTTAVLVNLHGVVLFGAELSREEEPPDAD